jgi:hypothetical protein
MNSIFFNIDIFYSLRESRRLVRRIAAVSIVFFLLISCAMGLQAQIKSDPTIEFKKLAAQLSTARLDGAAESEASQEMALGILDGLVSSVLSGSAPPDLEAANRRMAELVSHVPPVGENYRLVRLGGTSAAYALVVNFGLGGPAAVRIYSNVNGRYALAARIDHFVEKDFFDSDIELVPVSTSEPAFIIVAGRTDDLATGMFTAWRFDGCPKMTRDLYRLQAGEWKRIETKDLGSAKAATR